MFQCMGACLFHFVMKTFFVDIFSAKGIWTVRWISYHCCWVCLFVPLAQSWYGKMQMSKATAGTVSLKPKQTWHIQANNLAKPCLISKQVLSSRHVGNVAVQISCMKKRQNKNQTQMRHPRHFFSFEKPQHVRKHKNKRGPKTKTNYVRLCLFDTLTGVNKKHIRQNQLVEHPCATFSI